MNGKEARMTRNNPQNSQNDDAGSRMRMHTSDSPQVLNPGDEAAPGTPGTGEDICPQCHGSGRIGGSSCPNCAGSGMVVKAIGGA
jgi:DnaJ-class molecular chaperone